MEIDKVYGDRILLDDLKPYKSDKNSLLEVIQYTGAIVQAGVAYVGMDCKHTERGDRVLIQLPVGMDINFEGKKYLVIRELDILWSLSPGDN